MEKIPMTPVLILLFIFLAGFGMGYAARAWRSHKRHERYRLYAPYSKARSSSPESSFTRTRRAF
ncbi:hypothetical protein QCM80_40430 [Bradyrhizobium sp. SSUT112]|uniref:hypothetical protein n=1 Tax=Bradyrhizobium sp. SSUT112 TaxID=3040604 RepID=UPI00244B780E|nr:hypothetical protein [Bradyrhizobium sp. SSUT112]MDH2356839.1 hypothetical protein [Bradyrhizobium sp. SSUT112]